MHKEYNPNMFLFLEERLPKIGLDKETHGPYFLATTGPDELGEFIESLRGSSKLHGEDEAVWEQLTKDIPNKMKLDDNFRT
jgi:hypothetical protein